MKLTRVQWIAWACWRAGMSGEQIAYSTSTTVATAKTHVKRARAKLGADGGRFAPLTTVPHD